MPDTGVCECEAHRNQPISVPALYVASSLGSREECEQDSAFALWVLTIIRNSVEGKANNDGGRALKLAGKTEKGFLESSPEEIGEQVAAMR